MRNNIIAIDGPAGAGKSTIAKIIAEKIDFLYIDTGAMYRALTWKALKENINLDIEEDLYQLALRTKIEIGKSVNKQIIICDGLDVSDEIREPIISKYVSKVAKYKTVREILVDFQRNIANNNDVVMDGRDIGSNVLPHASYKFFLTASLEERARRRYLELQLKGYSYDFEQLKQEIAARDLEDSTRKYSPLIKAEDAIEINTDNLTVDNVVDLMLSYIGDTHED